MKERRKRRSTKDIEESIINAATRFIETEGFVTILFSATTILSAVFQPIK